jgi:hypothetical protein
MKMGKYSERLFTKRIPASGFKAVRPGTQDARLHSTRTAGANSSLHPTKNVLGSPGRFRTPSAVRITVVLRTKMSL